MDPNLFSSFLIIQFGYPEIIGILIVLVLLFCSALVSGAEVALFSLKSTDFPEENQDFDKQQTILYNLLQKPKKLLATILVANTFINIAIVLLFDDLGDKLFGDIQSTYFGINLQFILKVVVTTFFILLFGEIIPKIFATRKNVQFAIFMAQPLQVLDKILGGFSHPMRFITQSIENKWGKKQGGLSVDQLSQALDLADEGDTTEEEQEILQSIVSFGNTDTKQVMQPRTEVFGLNIQQTYKEILPELIDKGYSRIPVYKESIDNIEGILYMKDLLPYIDQTDFKWQELLRTPYFVPENKKLDDLLNEFKDQKNHLAIVVDEYGGTSGLITMEDIIEEIVGEISDEFDEDDLIFSKLDEDTFVFEGKTSLIDFYKIAGIEDSSIFEENKGEAETIAGFILEISEGLPVRGEEIKFENFSFVVEAVDEKRIKQVKFSKR